MSDIFSRKNPRPSGWQESFALMGISAVIVVLLFCFFHRLSPFIYLTNDDLFLKTIASGEVTAYPNPRLWYIGFPAGFLIASFYRLFPSLPWYGLFLCFAFGISMFAVLYQMLKAEKTWPVRMITIVLFSLFSYGFLFLHIAELQFTTVTGMAGAGAVFLFLIAKETDSLRETLKNYAGFFLMSALSFSIRDKGFLMLFPFIGMIGIGKLSDDKKGVRRKNLLAAALVFLGILAAVFLIDKIAYGSEEWKTFGSYTASSETIYDYTGYPDYEEYEEVYASLGITRSSYAAAAYRYNILLEPNINRKTMNTLKEIASSSLSVSLSELPGKGKEMAAFFLDRCLSYTDRPLNLLVYCCYILFFFCALLCGKKRAVRDILLTGIARMAIWIYLVYYGRLPSRVSQAVYLTELAVLLGIAFRYRLWMKNVCHSPLPDDERNTKIRESGIKNERRTAFCRMFWIAVICLLSALTFRFGFPKARAAASEAQSRLQFSQSFVELKDYFASHPDSFYYLDMNSFGSFTEDALQGGENQYGNYLFMGSWVPHSPWYTEKFERQQIAQEDAAKALYDTPGVYAVFMDTPDTGYEYLQDFYTENHPGVTLKVVESVDTSNDIRFLIIRGEKE